MFPILARYGSIFIYSYTVVLAAGIILATLLTARLQRSNPVPSWFDALLALFVGAVIGGRLAFIMGQWAYFQERPAEIFHIWQGGLSYYGALFAGLAALLLRAVFYERPFYQYGALFSPGMALVISFGWLACWFEGCAYGRETFLSFLSADLPDEFGVFALRYQTQLLGLLLSLAVFIFLVWAFRLFKPAALFWSALLLTAVAHLLPGLLRGDPAILIGPARLDVLLDGAVIIISILMLQFTRRK